MLEEIYLTIPEKTSINIYVKDLMAFTQGHRVPFVLLIKGD